ncbi:MAG: polyprenol monophosphomannose synthase [Elusimicrobia bacterium]|nr:polyprenol monophosphomannose synthase [Elusimicrobiota bacterium]
MDTLAVICTYNEATNIKQVIDEVLNCGLESIEALVVDDTSPDGTYKIVEELSKTNPKIHLLKRETMRGRGYAGTDGFKKALEMGAKFIVEMDGDGSHSPKYIPDFRKAIETADVVVGSRYARGGSDEKRGIIRQVVSLFARRYLMIILGVKVLDPTSGFRMFRREVLETVAPRLKAPDPFIVSEVLYYLKKYSFKITEVPIDFLPRISGTSKLGPLTLIKYLFKVLKLKVSSR